MRSRYRHVKTNLLNATGFVSASQTSTGELDKGTKNNIIFKNFQRFPKTKAMKGRMSTSDMSFSSAWLLRWSVLKVSTSSERFRRRPSVTWWRTDILEAVMSWPRLMQCFANADESPLSLICSSIRSLKLLPVWPM